MGYCFKNQTLKDWMSQINSRIKDDFQMLLACFVGYPVFLYNFVIICKSKVEFLFCEIQKQKVGSAKNLHLVHLNNLGRIDSAFWRLLDTNTQLLDTNTHTRLENISVLANWTLLCIQGVESLPQTQIANLGIIFATHCRIH